MTIRDWFILIFTFITGIFIGVYFYATAFAPVYEKKDLFEAANIPEYDFDIVGVQYGGYTIQGYNHSSFRVYSDGTYNYFSGGVEVQEKQTGNLPDGLLTKLKIALASSDLELLAQEIEPEFCVSYADGTEYEYNVDYDANEYTLDTCGTAYSSDSELGAVFSDIWRYMESPDTFSFSITNVPESYDEETGIIEEKVKKDWTLKGYFERGFDEAGFGD